MAAHKSVAVLIAKKESLFSLMQTIYDLSLKIAREKDMKMFLMRMQSVDKLRDDFSVVVEELNVALLTEDPKATPDFSSLISFDELFCYAKAAQEKCKQRQVSATQDIDLLTRKLPSLSLIGFDGTLSKFPIFYENFSSLIHNNKNLSNSEKVQYLMSQLSGSALSVCSGILPVGENYEVLWGALIEKYKNVRSLGATYFNQMFNYKLPSNTKNSIEHFLEHFCSSYSALKQLKDIKDREDFIVTHLALSKLDKQLVNLFEQENRKTDLPSFQALNEFLQEQNRIVMLTTSPNIKQTYDYNTKISRKTSQVFFASENSTAPSPNRCVCCRADFHPLYKCSKFLKLDTIDKIRLVKSNNFCVNCLGTHTVQNCLSKYKCGVCHLKHHTKLHIQKGANEDVRCNASRSLPSAATLEPSSAQCNESQSYLAGNATPNINTNSVAFSTFSSLQCNSDNKINLLPTAIIYISNGDGKHTAVRALLDSGATSHFLSKTCCDKLKLKITFMPSSVKGIGAFENPTLGYTKVNIISRYDSRCKYQICARVINKISDNIPHTTVCRGDLFPHLKNIPLADESFYVPAEIDCIIGSELFPLLLQNNKIFIPNTEVVGLETTLGYILMGKAAIPTSSFLAPSHSFLSADDSKLEALVKRFWEIENVPSKTHLSPEDRECERIFNDTCTRSSDGRYTVSLPFKLASSTLGDSKSIAKSRLLRMERRLASNPELRKGYNATFQEYLDKGYFSLDNNVESKPCYYMAHHAVFRPEKSTSKLRIVFDASCKTSTNISLNDCLYAGPNLQANIFSLLINLRLFPIALSADVEKMYFQIKLAADDHRYQKVLFRFRDTDDISTFVCNRVIFGVSSSPYLAMRVLKKLATDEADNYPLASQTAKHCFYMDDCVTSVRSVPEAKLLYEELVRLFMAGGFKLTKWISNSSEVMSHIPKEQWAPEIIDFDSSSIPKIVGMRWNPVEDYFYFHISAENDKCTKRAILSATARLYDPLSLLAPVTTLLKLLVQDCWKEPHSWDEEVSSTISGKWQQFVSELPLLQELKFPRHVYISDSSHRVSLLGFADASEVCLGAVVYLRVEDENERNVSVKLLCAKSKVAPLKKVSLARLELSAALLLANLVVAVKESIGNQVKVSDIFLFSDSLVTISWIRADSYRFQTFVANRISAIQEAFSPYHWHHIPGSENPADVITRPIPPSKLKTNVMWFDGPSWAKGPRSQWPISVANKSSLKDLPEIKASISLAATASVETTEHPVYGLASRISSYNKFLRACVYMLRFVNVIKTKGLINASDLEKAETIVVQAIQRRHFHEEHKSLANNKACCPAFRKLNAFLDEKGLIRVGGRLDRAVSLTYDQKHPLVLPAKDLITHLIVRHYHISNLHTGPSLLLALLRNHFWILSARSMVRKIVQQCNVCFKMKPKSTTPLMATLPSVRVSEVKSFVFTGTDYAGPFFITPYRRRGVRPTKAYICLFVCLTTKALHLELVSDLSSDMFLAAFKRFISRRGPVSVIMSDRGTNFVGAKRKLDELYSLLVSDRHNNFISSELASMRIQFKMNPAASPHFGGIWESNVKCVKTHLFKIIGNQILTYEEFSTVLVQIEGILNSRPLCVLSSDPSELVALTPAHFLNLTPLKYLPAEEVCNISDNRLDRFQLLDKLVQSFWKRWRTEYLTSLQVREKWNQPERPVNVGDVVVLKDDRVGPLNWPLAIITATYPGVDKITRVVQVRTKNGTFTRPVVKLCPLPLQ